MKISERCEFLLDVVDLPAATGVEDARWEYFQLAHLSDDGIFRIEDKSRQIAWSWLIAAEGVADAILNRRDSIYVSINQEEAKEKIRYARSVIEALRPDIRSGVQLVRDNELGIELENGARLSSLPARPPRGRSRSNVYLDEFAHVQHDKEIYTAALPVISKGGRLRIASSPMGATGRFWEVYKEQLRAYPGYRRKSTPWWEVYSFCRNPAEARKLAPAMETADRVDLFGNDRIMAIYANMPLEDFQQEYECEFVDESTAWITWEELKRNQDEALTCIIASGRDNAVDKVLDAIGATARAVDAGTIERVLSIGVDVGRTRNTTEIFAIGETTTKTYPLRMMLTLDNVEFDGQFDVLSKALATLPIKKALIDQNGIGRNLAENAAKAFPSKAEGVDFTNASKALWATDAKMLIQQNKTPLPVDRDLSYQIHSIKRRITAAKNVTYDTETNEKHHADKFWAWALGLAAAKQPERKVLIGFA
ncbi:MAG: terminase family protein [Caldilinea sp.]|nr:terminase family protein [Caldilinea sp.]